MARVIPALNAATEAEFRARAAVARSLGADWVQVDVSDGILGKPKNFGDPTVISSELRGLRVDVHLMVQDVSKFLATWETQRPARITVHLEAVPDVASILERLNGAHIACGIALGPETPVERALSFAERVALVLLVAVPPGESGQTLDPRTVERVRALHAACPTATIGVDGGVREEHVPDLLRAGVNTLVVASAIFDAPDPRAAYAELHRRAGPTPLLRKLRGAGNATS